MNKDNHILLAPSILAADFSRLGEEVIAVENGGADVIHIDVMDGMFVPNITFGPNMVQALKKCTTLPLDVHLMITDPGRYVEDFVNAGADFLTVHVEACTHLHRVLQHIKSLGVKCGVAINPATPLSVLDEVWAYIDMILIMTVNPGYGGQSFISSMLDKILRARTRIDQEEHSIVLAVDGGINAQTIPLVAHSGADLMVMGSYIYTSISIEKRLQESRELCLTR